jgi:hypothetical protein
MSFWVNVQGEANLSVCPFTKLTFLLKDGQFGGFAEFVLSSDWLNQKIWAVVLSLNKID